ncbi:MAG: DUF1579 domain-containing protein [Rubrivivax sp.]
MNTATARSGEPGGRATHVDPASSPHDFDFLIGDWEVHHRRLLRRLAGCTDWQTFGGRSRLIKVLDDHGTVDDNWIDLPGGAYRAVTLRSFDPASREWAIWWLDHRFPHRLDAPMRGHFRGGVGRFYADEIFDGRPIRVRFLWTGVAGGRPRWEQAFSTDGGASWEVNWEMDFRRRG